MSTRDAIRDASLRTIGGGSDGSRHFKIELPDREIQFTAYLAEGAWKVLGNWADQAVDQTIITEALSAFGYGHGFMANQVHSVLFLERRRKFFKTSYRWVNAQTH